MKELSRADTAGGIFKELPGVGSDPQIRHVTTSDETGQIVFWDGEDLILNANFGRGAAFIVEVARRSLLDSGSRCPTYKVFGIERI